MDNWLLVGSDASSLELRCLGHYMSRYDGGAYGKAVVEGKESDGTDVHSLNCKALGFDPQTVYTINGKSVKGRTNAKTFVYAFIYGAGNAKLAKTLGKHPGRGKRIREDFLARLPALGALIGDVKKAVKRGYLIGLDGRHMHIRSEHSALNTLLQGAGAAICKKWMVELERLMREQDWRHGWDGAFAFCIWAHDELQIAINEKYVRPAHVGVLAQQAIKRTEEFFRLQVPLDCEWKVGKNWKETH